MTMTSDHRIFHRVPLNRGVLRLKQASRLPFSDPAKAGPAQRFQFSIFKSPLSIVNCPLSIAFVSHKACIALILLILVSAPITVVHSQDVTLPKPVLPFQQDAPQQVNEEQLAIQLYQSQDYEKAATLFEKIYESKPSVYIYQYLLFSYVESKEFGKAERMVKKSMKAEGEAPKYLVDLGYIRYREGDNDRAKKYYEEALKKLTANQQQIFDLANAFITKGENEMAVQTYLKGRQLLNNTYPFGFELAGLYERMGNIRLALEEYLNLLEYNRAYLQTIQDRIQMLLSFDVNNEKNEIVRKVLLSRAQKYPDQTAYAEVLWWYSIQQRDFEIAFIQAKALDRRMKENGDKVIQLAGLAAANRQYDVAIDCHRYIIDKGSSFPYYDYSRRELLNTRYLKMVAEPAPLPGEVRDLAVALRQELSTQGEGPLNISLMRNLAHLDGFFLNSTDSAVALLNRAITMPGVQPSEQAQCKLELADIYLLTGEVWESTLLYQQVYQDYKNDVIGQEAKFRNTKLSFYIGEFMWAKAQADILKAATSKFIANDALALSLLIGENLDYDSNTVALGIYSRAELLDFRNEPMQALATLDSVKSLFGEHPIMQYVIYRKGMIRMNMGQFTLADSLFSQLTASYPDEVLADEALMQRAMINMNHLQNRPVAMECYQAILEKYPASIFVPEARQKFRMLRGDVIP